MCRVLEVGLHRHASSPARARRLLADTMRSWGLTGPVGTQDPEDIENNAVLLVDELVTNAVLHARSPARLVVAAANGTLEVGVTDLDPRPPRRRRVPAAADGLSIHGRGLALLESLSDEWGVVPLTVGKQVWFRLAIPAWPWATACVCDGEDLPRVRLGSGRYALAMPQPWDLPASAADPARA